MFENFKQNPEQFLLGAFGSWLLLRFKEQDRKLDNYFITVDQRFRDQEQKLTNHFITIDQRFRDHEQMFTNHLITVDQRFKDQDRKLDIIKTEIKQDIQSGFDRINA